MSMPSTFQWNVATTCLTMKNQYHCNMSYKELLLPPNLRRNAITYLALLQITDATCPVKKFHCSYAFDKKYHCNKNNPTWDELSLQPPWQEFFLQSFTLAFQQNRRKQSHPANHTCSGTSVEEHTWTIFRGRISWRNAVKFLDVEWLRIIKIERKWSKVLIKDKSRIGKKRQ